jgi:hypothetical protein
MVNKEVALFLAAILIGIYSVNSDVILILFPSALIGTYYLTGEIN